MTRRILATGAVIVVMLFVDGALSAQTHQGGGIVERVALDNESVRVALLTIPAGASSGIHMNAEPELGIVTEGKLTLVTRNGKEVVGPGRVIWLPPATGHDARNEGTRPVRLWALSLKRCE